MVMTINDVSQSLLSVPGGSIDFKDVMYFGSCISADGQKIMDVSSRTYKG